MSDLFDMVLGEALDLDIGRRRSAPEPPPLPPGIPALPPDPRAIAAGLAAIRAHDPGFDAAAMVAGARAVWHRTAGTEATAAGALRDVAISAVQAGPSLEAITVRFGTAAGEADWVFQRAATATTPTDPVASQGHCPSCGAPLQLDDAGACPYCHTAVLGTPGWTLVARNLLRPMTDRDAVALAMVAASAAAPTPAAPVPPPPAAAEGVDLGPLGVDAYSLLASARETVYAVAQARSQRRPALVAGRVTGDLAAALGDEAAATAARHRHHVLAFLEVSDAVVTAAVHGGEGDRVTVRLRLTGEEYEIADAGLDVVEGDQTMHTWSEDWVFTRSGPAAPWLAASRTPVGG